MKNITKIIAGLAYAATFACADAVQAVLDGWIADSEELLHLFDRPMAAHKGRYKNLILCRQPGQRRKLEATFDCDVAASG